MSEIFYKPKWTIFFLYFLLITQILAILAFIAVYLVRPTNGGAIAFLVGFIGLFAAFNADTLMRLQRRESRGWTQALIVTCMSMLSILFPLAVAVLTELLNDTKKKAYLEGVGYHQKTKWSPLLMGGLATAVMIGSIAILLMVGKKQSEKKQEGVAGSFQLAPNLSLPELGRLGAECNTARNLECSEAVYTKIIELDPSDTIAIANLAMTKTKLAKHEDAERLYKIFFANSGVAVDVLAYYGETLTALEKHDEALLLYKDFISQYPRYVDVANSYFSLLQRVKGARDALNALEAYLQKTPEARQYFYQMHKELMQKASTVEPTSAKMESV